MKPYRREQIATAAAVTVSVAAAWLYLFRGPMPGSMGESGGMAGMDMSADTFASWSLRDAVLLFAMWSVMMVAMMLPSAAPMILIFARIKSARVADGRPNTPTSFFTAGYIAVWIGFSVLAALAQWTLHSLAVLSPEMRAVSPFIAGLILIAAGIYQWMPVKHSCLSHCQSPLGFLTTSWREGKGGALSMGFKHGVFCVGCCWALMALLFAGGVMNLLLVAAISVVVLLEKILGRGQMFARLSGSLLIFAGAMMMIRGV